MVFTHRKHNWKIFETARAAKAAGSHSGSCSASMLGTSDLHSDDSYSVSQRSSMYFSDTESAVGDSSLVSGATGGVKGEKKGSDLDSLYRSVNSDSCLGWIRNT